MSKIDLSEELKDKPRLRKKLDRNLKRALIILGIISFNFWGSCYSYSYQTCRSSLSVRKSESESCCSRLCGGLVN